jgi:hypothetical protein
VLQRIKQNSDKQDKKKTTLRLSRSAAHQSWLAGLTDNFKFQEHFSVPNDIDIQMEITKRDLEEVPVLDRDRKVVNARTKLENDPDLDAADKDLIWTSLTVVRLNFQRLDSSTSNAKRASFQWEMNWKHTRAEVNQVCEASRLLGLSAREMRDAVVASIFSDAIKNRSNFVIHNIHGAQAAACSLSGLLPFDESGIQSMNRITRAIKEHQVAPPEFMSDVVSAHIAFACGFALKHLSEWDFSQAKDENSATISAINAIRKKIANPFEKAHLSKDLQTIDFTDEERSLLKAVNIEEWYVPHPENECSKVSHAVIAGDHCINYNHPEGFAKIALLRGPDCDPLFQDDTIHTSLASAVASFSDSYRILRVEIQPMAINGLRRTKRSVERVTAIMRELFSGIIYGGEDPNRKSGHRIVEQSLQRAEDKHAQLFDQRLDNFSGVSNDYRRKAFERVGDILQEWYDAEGELPFEASEMNAPGDVRLPYWNAPLKYPPRLASGQPDDSCLSELEQKQFAFAQRIREIAVELLRAEEWVF